MPMTLTRFNRQLVLARQLGYHCGLNKEPQFQFPNVEKAWNEYRTYIKDEATARGWKSYSSDDIEREFRRGYGQALNEKREQSR